MSNLILYGDIKCSIEANLSNFIALKLFNDIGIDVNSFPEYLIDFSGYSNNFYCVELVHYGLKSIFEDVKVFDPFNNKSEIQDLLNKGLYKYTPEYVIIINDERLRRVSNISKIEKELKNYQYMDFSDLEISLYKYQIVISIFFEGFLHELVEKLILINNKLNKNLEMPGGK